MTFIFSVNGVNYAQALNSYFEGTNPSSILHTYD